MTGLEATAAVIALSGLAWGGRALLQRRRFALRPRFAAVQRVALRGTGGRALASHVQSLSDLGMYLQPPPARR